MPSKEPKHGGSDLGRYTAMSFKMGIVITAGFLGGYYLDDYLGFEKVPLFTLLLGFIGLALSIYVVFVDTRKR